MLSALNLNCDHILLLKPQVTSSVKQYTKKYIFELLVGCTAYMIQIPKNQTPYVLYISGLVSD